MVIKIIAVDSKFQGKVRPLVCHLRHSLLPHFFVYHQQQWVGTINKGTDEKYKLISGGLKSLTVNEVETLGQHIDRFELV